MSKPKLLDLFCGVGGASMGYERAGFEVYGVDIRPMPNYPFDFLLLDALKALDKYGHKFNAFHASPPCQASSALTKGTNAKNNWLYEDLIGKTRDALDKTGKLYVIENVQSASLREDLKLCGEMFGLNVIRHRIFETNWPVTRLNHIKHKGKVAGFRHGVWQDGPYFAVYGDGGGKGNIEQWQQAMGIDWATERRELAQAIPPAYTEYIGRQMLAAL